MNQLAIHQENKPVETNSILTTLERLVLNPEVDPAKIHHLLDAQERILAKRAESDFFLAMNKAQNEMGRVAANKVNAQTKSKYASYDALDRALRPVYSNHGFSLSFNTEPVNIADVIRVTCDVSHLGGHTKHYAVNMPADGKGAKGGDVMTKTHAAGAAMSYGMRYLLKMIFNVAIGEDDTDGNVTNEPDVTDWVLKISESLTLDDLKKNYTEAYNEVKAFKTATALVNRAKDARKKELSA